MNKISDKTPAFNSREMNCIICEKLMFYSEENLVHVCLEERHGILCYFEPDRCWFAASLDTASRLGSMGLKFHHIPENIFVNASIGKDFKCNLNSE